MLNILFFRHLSTYLLSMAVLLSLSGFYLGYIQPDHRSLPAQVSGHLMLLIGPGLLKIGYVLHLAVEESTKATQHPGRATLAIASNHLP
ncbi:transmembrane sensor/regulator PpyR [Chitinimonas sp. BJB300]|uniref:transmembrane sensor/regulator PpyR n=1 Tax=Chitinimonas sp. BJB300 TaxID=1559339 RepID=UPI000C10212B|nr:transmembrane sensor/regulator PpyR [Chitinimonas sp. BJB300]PHV11351.1 transmembrane sensor/regulator PpyR [Chitinimonas sp. BJB300]TSJ87475.1 transmembrane sensor/regulator PpyR [Chitinimonas sp. BJB300]